MEEASLSYSRIHAVWESLDPSYKTDLDFRDCNGRDILI